MKFLFKRSFWALLTVYMSVILIIVMVASNILTDCTKVINTALGLKGYRIQTINNGESEDLEYFTSNYVKKDENGNIIYTTDENGYTHQVYDDVALREAAIAKAMEVQREGTTILWNSDNNGLPLSEGAKVSLFSQSTVSWGYSGGGSGAASAGSNMRAALTNAGLEVLSVVAYNQPVTRSAIEFIRGVNSDGPLNNLVASGLVKENGSRFAILFRFII